VGLDRQFRALEKRANQDAVTVPFVLEVVGDTDNVVAAAVKDVIDITEAEHDAFCQRAVIRTTGGHFGPKEPADADEPTIAVIVKFLQALFETRMVEVNIAEVTLERSVCLDGYVKLFRDDADVDFNESDTGNYGWAGDQGAVYDCILNQVSATHQVNYTRLVTGVAGVGKSTALRMVTRRLAWFRLIARQENSPIPIFIPLQQVSIASLTNCDTKTKLSVWLSLKKYWASWVSDIVRKSCCIEIDAAEFLTWIDSVCNHSNAVVILDGIDDFVVNNSGSSAIVLNHLRRDLNDLMLKNSNLCVIFGSRSSLSGLRLLVPSRQQIMSVQPLTTRQIRAVLPTGRIIASNVNRLLENMSDEASELLLTPLIIVNLAPHLINNIRINIKGQRDMLVLALETIIEGTHLTDERMGNDPGSQIDDWMWSLSITAWLGFSAYLGDIGKDVLESEVSKLASKWSTRTQKFERTSITEAFSRGLELLKNKKLCFALMNRTILVPAGPDRFRFHHRAWQDVLVSRYLAFCLHAGNRNDLGIRGFNKNTYRWAAEELLRWKTVRTSTVLNVDLIKELTILENEKLQPSEALSNELQLTSCSL